MRLSELKPYTDQLNVLIVEDEEALRTSLEKLFCRLFKNLKTASDGVEALEIFKSSDIIFDMVITDINMPNMNGIELGKAIQEINPLTPVIALSAHNESSYLIDAINSGFCGFLSKPLEYDLAANILYRNAVFVTGLKDLEEYKEKLELQNIELETKSRNLEKAGRQLVSRIMARDAIVDRARKRSQQSVGNGVIKIKNAVEKPAQKQETFEHIKQEAIKIEPVVQQPTHIDSEQHGAYVLKNSEYQEYHSSLSSEDIYELNDLIEEIEHFVFMTIQNDSINAKYIDKLNSSFRKFGNITYRYPIFGELSTCLFKLSSGIEARQQDFIQKQDFIMPFLENLVYVLQKYVQDVWLKPAVNPNFYDASIMNDINTFLVFLGDDTTDTQQADDLLEFF